MPTRSEQTHSVDALKTSKASERGQNRPRECQIDERQSSRHRSRSSHSTSSSSSSSSSSSGSASSTSSETGSTSSSSSDSSGSSRNSGDKMTGGSDCKSRGTIPAAAQSNRPHEGNDAGLRKHLPSCTGVVVDGRISSPSSPAKPEVETKTSSGLKTEEIVCLSPSKIERQTKDACSVIPVEMASDLGENGRRNRIRIVLGGKLFPLPVNQLYMSDSLRSISLYSDDEVDCNDDGRSLDRPLPQRITSERPNQVNEVASKHPTESHKAGNVEVPLPKSERVSISSTGEDCRQNEPSVGKTKAEVPSSERREFRQNAANVDDHSRSPQRQRIHADRRTERISSREERRTHDSSERKSRSPEVDLGHRRSSRQSVGEPRGRSEHIDGHIVAVDRGASYHQRSATERYPDSYYGSRREDTRSGRHNEVSQSRSQRDSRSRSPNRYAREETGSCSSSRDYRRSRAEVDERQRRWSKHDVTSVSGRRPPDRQTSRARPEVESRYWRDERVKESCDVVTPTVPPDPRRSRHGGERSVRSTESHDVYSRGASGISAKGSAVCSTHWKPSVREQSYAEMNRYRNNVTTV